MKIFIECENDAIEYNEVICPLEYIKLTPDNLCFIANKNGDKMEYRAYSHEGISRWLDKKNIDPYDKEKKITKNDILRFAELEKDDEFSKAFKHKLQENKIDISSFFIEKDEFDYIFYNENNRRCCARNCCMIQ